MSTKTALFLLALMLIALHFALKMEPTPLTETEKAKLDAEFQKDTVYSFTPDEGAVIRTAIFKAPKDKPIFWIYREHYVRNAGDYRFKSIYPVIRIEFGEILRESHRKSLAERISTE